MFKNKDKNKKLNMTLQSKRTNNPQKCNNNKQNNNPKSSSFNNRNNNSKINNKHYKKKIWPNQL